MTTSHLTFRQETRVQRSLLTRLEKRTLYWLALRLPRSVHSDHLTALALVAMAGVGISYWLAGEHPLGLIGATVGLAVNWFGDSLDGTLARVRQQQRPRYGYYVDHLVDVVGALFLFVGLGLSGFMQPWIAVALLVAYFLVSMEVYLATHSLGTFNMSVLGIGPTELRLLLAAGNLTLYWRGNAHVFGLPLSVMDIGGIIGIAGLMGAFCYSAVTHTRLLYRAEPLTGPAAE